MAALFSFHYSWSWNQCNHNFSNNHILCMRLFMPSPPPNTIKTADGCGEVVSNWETIEQCCCPGVTVFSRRSVSDSEHAEGFTRLLNARPHLSWSNNARPP